jgi:hypothetical protein
MEELLKYSYLSMWLNQLTLNLPSLVMEIFITLMINDHVVHDYKKYAMTSHMVSVLHVLGGC